MGQLPAPAPCPASEASTRVAPSSTVVSGLAADSESPPKLASYRERSQVAGYRECVNRSWRGTAVDGAVGDHRSMERLMISFMISDVPP